MVLVSGTVHTSITTIIGVFGNYYYYSSSNGIWWSIFLVVCNGILLIFFIKIKIKRRAPSMVRVNLSSGRYTLPEPLPFDKCAHGGKIFFLSSFLYIGFLKKALFSRKPGAYSNFNFTSLTKFIIPSYFFSIFFIYFIIYCYYYCYFKKKKK